MQEMNRYRDRLRLAGERAVLIQILEDLKNEKSGCVEIAGSFCESIPIFRKFLTPNEIASKLDEIIIKSDPFSSFYCFSGYLGSGKTSNTVFAEVRIVLNWIKLACENNLEKLLMKSLEVGSEDDFAQQKYNELVLSLLALPARISNCEAIATSKEENCYTKECLSFLKTKMVESVHNVLKAAHSKIGVSDCVNLRTIAALIAKGRNLIVQGTQNSTFLQNLVDWICCQKEREEEMKWNRVAQRLFTDESYGYREYEALATSLILNAKDAKQLETCFGSSLNTSANLKRVFYVKLLFHQVVERVVLRNVLDFIDVRGGEVEVAKLLEKSIKIWSNYAFVRTSTIEQHRHTTSLILYILYLIRKRKSESRLNWQTIFMSVSDGVQLRLSNSDLQIRQTGMFVGEAVSKFNEAQMRNGGDVNEEEEKKRCLSFDYEEDDWVAEMREILKNGIGAEKKIISVERSVDMKAEMEINHNQPTLKNDVLDSDDDEDFPTYDVAEDEKVFEKLSQDQEPLRKSEAPRYINDAFEQLLEKEKYEIFEAALFSLEKMIRRNAIGFTSIGSNLAARLVFLDDRFSTPDFEKTRKSCLVACLVTRPEIVPNIVQLMLGSDCSMSHRFIILDVIRCAAKELAQPKQAVSSAMSELEQKPSTSADSDSSNWKEVVEARIKSKTRRITREKEETVVFVENRLGKVAKLFFYPLLVQSTGEHLELRGRDSALMSKIIFTMTDVMQHSGLSPQLPDMAINLIRYVTPWRFSEDHLVRIAVLFSYCSVVDCLPIALLETFFDSSTVTEWVTWALQVAESVDANENERKLASCLVTELWKKIEAK